MAKGKKSGKNACVNNKPSIDNDQLGENVYEKFAPDGNPDKKSKK